ncbi:MAG TPA: response regulator [Polyangiales bacterium]|nr:response regulator [Polyangiales bacterium]
MAPAAPARILLADDSRTIRESVTDILSALENVTVTSVENGAQALKEASTGEYSLLISDIEMPVMSGIQLLRVLRSQFFSGTELPIIMLTQLDHAEQKARAFADGANDYVTKPVEKQELIARARAQIELRELHRRNLTNQALELNAQKLSAVAQLSATLAHELNTPAQFLGDNLAFLSNAFAQITQYLDEQVKELPSEIHSLRKEIPSCVRDMEEGLVRIAKLVQTISEFADAKSQRLGQVDLERNIEATVELLRSRWLGLVDITIHHGPQVGQLIAWPHELKHALWQLITQAIDHATVVSSDKGRVHIATSLQDENIVISVRAQSGGDHPGSSMPPASKEAIRMLRAVLNQHGADLSCEQAEDGVLTSIIRLAV